MTYEYTDSTVLVVSLAEAKLHLRVDDTNEDTLISALIWTATQYAQNYCNRLFIATDITAYADDFYSETVLLKKGQVTALTSVKYYNTLDVETTWPTTEYQYDIKSIPARIAPKSTKTYPSTMDKMNAVKYEYKVGWTNAAEVPDAIKQAILLIIGGLYSHREDSVFRLPTASQNLLNTFRLNYL
jgi:uncharacterized phiE125 gp8 family phage protein|tara:strand:- start:1632 stop:2186 length:555 start_codon:yes stop_codon:yes gene_type:complete